MNERMNVLVVDDEPLIRKGLKSLLEKRTDIGTVYEASNGISAQNIIENEAVQLVFADIRMPKMDGIELLSWISLNHPNVKTVVLSAFQDFDYAKQTFLSGTLDYLLKHEIDEDQLDAVLQKVKLSINREQGNDIHRMRRLLLEGVVPDQLKEIHGCVICAAFEEAGPKNAFVEYMENRAKLEIVFERSAFYGFLPKENANQILEGLPEGARGGMDCGVSKFGIVTEILALKTQAESALGQCFFSDKPAAIFSWEEGLIPYANRIPVSATDSQAESLRLLYEARKAFLERCVDGDTAGIVSWAKGLHGLVMKNAYEPQGIRLFYESIFEFLFFRYADILLGAYLPDETRTFLTEAKRYGGIHEKLMECLRYIANKNISIVELETCSNAVKSVVIYINMHYADKDLSLEKIARKLGYSGAYISRVFKKETSVGVVDYINGVRILNAACLLKNNKAGDVAYMIGYNNYNYFHKNFRKIMGVSPSEYDR